MSNRQQNIEWDVPIEDVQIGIPVGYEVQFSSNNNFTPVLYSLDTFRDNRSAQGTFYYSLDNGVTWVDYPLGDSGYAFYSAYKMRIVTTASVTGYIYANKGGIIYRVTPDGSSIMDRYMLGSFDSTGFGIDGKNTLYISGQNKTLYKIDTSSGLRAGNNSVNIHSDPLGIVVDSPRNRIWQIDYSTVSCKDLEGNTLFTRNLPEEIDVEWSSSSSSSHSSFSNSSISHSYSSNSSSSSSSSSTSSSSSSSTEIRSSSSSSEVYCIDPECIGNYCWGWRNFIINGMNNHNSDSGRLYLSGQSVGFPPTAQALYLWKDSGLTQLVAQGSCPISYPQTLTFTQANSSGLTGSAQKYNNIYYDSFMGILDCFASSSSSTGMRSSSSSSSTEIRSSSSSSSSSSMGHSESSSSSSSSSSSINDITFGMISSNLQGSGTNRQIPSFTVSNNRNRILVLAIQNRAENSATTMAASCSFGFLQNFTRIATPVQAVYIVSGKTVYSTVELWYLINPVVTTDNIYITMTGSLGIPVSATCMSIYNVAQETPSYSSAYRFTSMASPVLYEEVVTAHTNSIFIDSMAAENTDMSIPDLGPQIYGINQSLINGVMSSTGSSHYYQATSKSIGSVGFNLLNWGWRDNTNWAGIVLNVKSYV